MKLPHFHWFVPVRLSDRHIHTYRQCRCGARGVSLSGRGFQPLAKCWLDGEDWPCSDLKGLPCFEVPDRANTTNAEGDVCAPV